MANQDKILDEVFFSVDGEFDNEAVDEDDAGADRGAELYIVGCDEKSLSSVAQDLGDSAAAAHVEDGHVHGPLHQPAHVRSVLVLLCDRDEPRQDGDL